MSNLNRGFKATAILISLLLTACGSSESGTAAGEEPSVTVPASEIAVNLPKTGQSTCLDSNDVVMDCTNTGQDGDLQTGVDWPNPRFSTDGTGNCMIDNLTGRMWARQDGGFRTWQLALDYANNLNLCGFTDWRMPNRKELLSLVNYTSGNSGAWLLDNGFNVQVESVLWSSTSVAANTTEAWSLIAVHGILTQQSKAIGNYILPVRGGM